MSVITAKGTQARENAQKTKLDAKKIYLRLKEDEQHAVRLLSVEDYVEYQSSSDYESGIFTQPISGENSPLIIANKKGGAKFSKLYAVPRYVFVFGSLETGELVAWDASKNQAKALISTIEEYAEDIKEFGFNLKRTGTNTSTVYSLNMIPRLKGKQKENFEALEGQVVEMDFFEKVIEARINDDKFIVKLLAEIDSSVLELFPDIDISEDETEVAAESKPLDISDDDLPF